MQIFFALPIDECTLVKNVSSKVRCKDTRKGKDSARKPMNQGEKCLLIYTCMSVPVQKTVT